MELGTFCSGVVPQAQGKALSGALLDRRLLPGECFQTRSLIATTNTAAQCKATPSTMQHEVGVCPISTHVGGGVDSTPLTRLRHLVTGDQPNIPPHGDVREREGSRDFLTLSAASDCRNFKPLK